MNITRHFVTARTLHRAFNSVACPLPEGTTIKIHEHPKYDGAYYGKWTDEHGRAWRVTTPNGDFLKFGHDFNLVPSIADLKAMLL